MVDELPHTLERRLKPILERLEKELKISRELSQELTRQGYQTIIAVAEADPKRLSQVIPGQDSTELEQVIEQARERVGYPDLKSRQEKREDMESLLHESGDTHLQTLRYSFQNQSRELEAIREAYFGFSDIWSVARDIGMACGREELIPFIGSGFSRNVNCELPTWGKLADWLIDDLAHDAKYREALEEMGPARVAELYINQYGRKRLFDFLTEVLDVSDEEILSSEPHIHLATMRPQRIYTTNYDCFIERVFSETPTPIKPIVHPQTLSSVDERSPQIVKLHGSLNYRNHDNYDPQDIIISESDFYSRIRDSHPFETLLQADIFGKSILFMGYGFNDPNIGYLWNLLSSLPNWTFLKTSYFIDYPGHFTDRINIPMAEYLASRKIMLISPRHEAPNDDESGISDFLEAVSAHAASEPTINNRKPLPRFLPPRWLARLQKAHEANDEALVKSELYQHPQSGAALEVHRKDYQELLKDITETDYANETRRKALQSLQNQLAAYANNERGINFQTRTIDDVGLFIMQCIYDDDLRMMVESFILNQSHQVKHALFNEFIDDLSLRRDSIPLPEPALTMIQMIYRSSSMHLLFQREEVKESLETLEKRFPDHQSAIGRTIQLTTR